MVDDLQALSRLRDLAMLSVDTAGLEPILAEVLDSAIAISGADFGNVQLIDPATSGLRIAAQRGFPAWWIDFWNVAGRDHGVCDAAIEHKARVIVEDVKESPLFVGKPALDVQLRANVRAVHSTPLLSRDDQAVGVLSVHHRKPHRPDDRVLRWFDLLSRQAADMIDGARVTAALRDSESRFRALAMASWDVLYRMSPDWYQMRSLEGKGFIADTPQATEDWLTRYIPPDDQPLVVAAVRRAIETQGLFDLEHRVRRVDGTLAWIHSRAVPLLGADGEIVEWFGAARDVTEARQSQARLFEEEQRLQALLQSLPLGVAFTNSPDCAHVQGNAALHAQFGAGPGDNVSASAPDAGAYGHQIVYLRNGVALAADELPLQRAAHEGRTIEPMELDVHLPSGRQLFVEVSGAPIRNVRGDLIGAVAVSTDITERKRAAETREQARLKDEFLAVLGHELRNPLAALSGAVDAQAGDLTSAERDAMDQLIRRQVGVLRRLVDDLLDIARITHGKIRLQKEPFSLAELLGAASAAARVATDQRAQRLSAAVRGADVLFEADRVRMQQIVANLLDNASKYSGHGGTIELTGALEGSEIVLRCKDSGSGVAPEMHERIFEPLVRVESDARGAPPGLGLGLALVRRLAELHGGSATVKSGGPNTGSEFTVRIPFVAPKLEAPAPAATPAAAPNKRSASIVIVEDNPDVAQWLTFVMKRAGHRVTWFADGPAALRGTEEAAPDAVLIDIGLPDMSGFEVLAGLRGQPRLARTLFIGMSGLAPTEDEQRGSRFDHYLVKPMGKDQILTLIHKHLQP